MRLNLYEGPQKHIPGLTRQAIWGALDPQQRAWAERQAAQFDTSLSNVVNTALSVVSGIPLAVDRPKSKARLLKMRRPA